MCFKNSRPWLACLKNKIYFRGPNSQRTDSPANLLSGHLPWATFETHLLSRYALVADICQATCSGKDICCKKLYTLYSILRSFLRWGLPSSLQSVARPLCFFFCRNGRARRTYPSLVAR
jgi:hypothetical protein